MLQASIYLPRANIQRFAQTRVTINTTINTTPMHGGPQASTKESQRAVVWTLFALDGA